MEKIPKYLKFFEYLQTVVFKKHQPFIRQMAKDNWYPSTRSITQNLELLEKYWYIQQVGDKYYKRIIIKRTNDTDKTLIPILWMIIN